MVLKALARMHFKTRTVDRVLRRQYPLVRNRSFNDEAAEKERRLLLKEDTEAKKKQRLEDKEAKTKREKAENQRRNEQRAKYREFEKTVRAIRESFLKTLKRRREEARVRVEVICDREEAYKLLVKDEEGQGQGQGQGLKQAAPAPTTAAALLQRAQQQQRSKSPFLPCPSPVVDMLRAGPPEAAEPRPLPRPEPARGSVPLDGEAFGHVLELWGFLCTFSAPLKVSAVECSGVGEWSGV